MPVNPTFPGVYIQEAPSSVRTITGVATSITAFVGKTGRGPLNTATTINSFADFERTFGGLVDGTTLGFAVRDFYLNGGSQAIIVRLASSDAHNAVLPTGGLNLTAASPGSWGNNLRSRVDHNILPPDPTNTLFNLFVKDMATGQLEIFRNVSITPGNARQVDKVLQNTSKLVTSDLPAALPTASPTPAPGKDPWDPSTSYVVPDANRVTDGGNLTTGDFTGHRDLKEGIFALEQVDLFNLLCLPPYLPSNATANDITGFLSVLTQAAEYCVERRAMLIVDSPTSWTSVTDIINPGAAINPKFTDITNALGALNTNAALFFPGFMETNPLHDNQLEQFAPSGAVAGVFARIDTQRGVWKAPAGLEAALAGVSQLSEVLSDAENGQLNHLGINCFRTFPAAGQVVWGARTLAGDDRLASQWKYIPVRRTALYIEESLYRGTQWVVFEPNDEPLWAQIRLNVGAFMHNLFVKGAFQGTKPQDAYFVKCDNETNPQDQIDLGIVNIIVGFAPLKPAEFVVITIQQIAGQLQV